MSLAAKTTIPIHWIIISPYFRPDECIEKKLGFVFNDIWSLKLLKKSIRPPVMFNIMLSIERKRADNRAMAIIKLKFSDPHRNHSVDVKYIKKFHNPDNKKASYTLNGQVRQLFTFSESVCITGEVFFHMIPSSKPVTTPQTLNTLSTDLGKLCYSNIFSDVILRCGSDVFTAHKNILATRCPVFAEILEKKVNDEVKIDIKDLAPHVLKAVLLFIYSGEPVHMTFQLACELLSASGKYRLNELKALCVNHITSSLSVENVLDYFHKYDEVKSYALEFIAENILEIKRTKQWIIFKQQFPDLVSKLESASEIKNTSSYITQECTNIQQECPNIKQECLDIEQEYPNSKKECPDIKQECSGLSS